MAHNPNNVFHLPGQPEFQPAFQPELASQPQYSPESQAHVTGKNSPLQDALRLADSVQVSPEKQPEAYRFLVDAGKDIGSYRDMAMAQDRERNQGFLKRVIWGHQELTETNIIDTVEQNLVYGKASGASFFMGDRNQKVLETRGNDDEEVVHWYFSKKTTLPDGRPSELTLHYENTPTTLSKWYHGKPYSLTMQEIENLSRTVLYYKKAVEEKLSPVDATIDDLRDEINDELEKQERIIAAHSQEVMFSKAAVDRMVTEYRAKKAFEAESERQLQENMQRDINSHARFQARSLQSQQDDRDSYLDRVA